MKKFILPSLMVLALVLFAATTVFANGQQQTTSASKGPTKVTVWDIQTGADQTMINTAVKQFNDAHPNTQITVEWFQNNPYKDKLRIALGAGNGPDVFYNWGGGPLRSYVSAGDAVDLTPYLNADPSWKNKFPESVWGPATVNGKIYGIPTQGSDAELLFYNKKLLSKYNLPVPTTVNDLMTDVKALRSHGINPIGLAGKSEWPEMIWVQYLVDRIGGPKVFDAIAKGESGAWSNPAVIKALEICQELAKANAFEPGFASVDASTSQAEALVATDRAAMVAQGDWVYSTFINKFGSFVQAGNLGYTAMPSVNAQYAKEVVGAPSNYYSISNTSKNIKADLMFLRDVNNNDYWVHTMINNLGRIPPVKGVGEQIKSMKNGAFDTWLYEQINNAPEVQLYWDQYLSPTVAKQMLTNISKIFLLQETPQQFAANMNKTLSQS